VADGTIGMDVNAIDRWGWSALSMCGYGGHIIIARLLLDHGANIDNDVDGDTPKSLATQRGHADLLIMLEEEEALRKLKASEAKQ
jgi:ankyrin repeat protein